MTAGIDFLKVLEGILTCITPVILAIIGLRQTKANKKVDDYAKAQSEIEGMRKAMDERQKEDLEQHFKKIESSIDRLQTQVDEMRSTVETLSKLDRQISSLIELSNVNFEFCQSLSTIVSGIADALDSTDAINSADLKEQLAEHRKTEQALAGRIVKIVY